MRRSTSMLRKVRSGLSVLLRSESGLAMPTVLMVTVISLGLGSAAAVASINAQQGSVRDYDTKAAIAAAEAGAERALYRHNKILSTPAQPCLVTGTGGTLVPGPFLSDGWCPEVSGTVAGTEYSYRTRPVIASGSLQSIDIVSTGTSDEVSRRIEIGATTPTPQVFSEFNVIGDDFVDLDANSDVDANVASNGSVTLDSNSEICGNIQHGVGAGVTFGGSSHQCAGFGLGEGVVDLPLVDQGDVVTNNANGRFFGQDIRSSATRVTWDPATRTLDMDPNSALTLAGTNYSFCQLTMGSNTTIFIAAGAEVRVYFDSPEACGQADNTTQMDLSSNSQITSTGGSPAAAAFLFVGSETLSTRAELSSNTSLCSFEVILYGPLTDFVLNSNTNVCGGIAGKSVHMDSDAHVQAHSGTDDFTLPVPLHYELSRYVECTGTSVSPPDAAC